MAGRKLAEAATHRHIERVESGSVIVGVDGSCGAQIALEWAQHHVGRLGPIVAATCWHRPWWGSASHEFGHGLPDADEVLEHRAIAHATAAVDRLDIGEDDPPVVIAAEGMASERLLELASDAHLLVVGSRGRSPVVGSLLGSTSAHCAHHSTVPVAIVPDGIDPLAPVGHIAVGVDGSANSMEALRWTLRMAPAGAVIDVFFSWMTLPIASSLTAPELDRVRASCEDFLGAIVDRLIGEEQAWHRTIRRHLSVGDPAAVLLASEASMIVVGARSAGGLISTLLRSPANSLVHATRAVTVFVPSSRLPSERNN